MKLVFLLETGSHELISTPPPLPHLFCSEILYEDVGFRSREFAALVASKVFYHLGAFEESLNYALGAGNLFNVNDNSEYVETIIGRSE